MNGLKEIGIGTMNEVRDNAINFEAVKIGLSQTDKSGVILRLSIHPHDVPTEVLTDALGSRYVVAMVRLNDQDEVETRQNEQVIQRLIASCGLLCREADFQAFLGVENEDDAVESIRKQCGIKSRSEFRDNVSAREAFKRIREEYKLWTK